MTEITFTAQAPHADPFYTVTLDVVFTDLHGNKLRVPAFWAGGNAWKVRYASSTTGTHRYRTECSDTKDAGLHNVSGTIEVEKYMGQNPLFVHGPIRVAGDRRHLEHADGTPFFWLADTWWMGLCHRLHWPEEVAALAADRKAKGFNVIQIVAGLYPDMHPFDPRGVNEAGFPWEEKYARIRPEYFDAADRRIQYLVDQGFSPCIVGAWGYFMPWMGVDKAQQHWRYLIARYGAPPVTWCAAGEANLPWYLAKGFPYDDRAQVAEWTTVLRYIRATDPFHRPLTIHPTGIGRLSSRNATVDASLLDFDMLQTPHGQREAVDPTVQTMQQSYADNPTMPVINGEAAYEMLGDTLPTKWTRQMFWLCMTNGAAGHTYGANGIWQCNRPGEPHGPSPHHNGGVGYGKIPWNDAMNLPGSAQVALGKQLFERFKWWKFEPNPSLAAYDASTEALPPEDAKWVWLPEGDARTDAPGGKVYFRTVFNLKENAAKQAARLWVSADDRFTVYLNGIKLADHTGTGTYLELVVESKLQAGENVLAVEAENLPAPVAKNPAGMLASLRIRINDNADHVIENAWRCSKDVPSDGKWTTSDFDARHWPKAKELGNYGSQPWGRFPSGSYGPYATGIPGKLWIVYVPVSKKVLVQRIGAGEKFRAMVFDPTSGKTHKVGVIDGAKLESLVVARPDSVTSDDWVIVLENDE